jgi:hypothetical protein
MKKIIMLVLLLNLFGALTCVPEEDACDECKAAQEHYYQALLNNSCNTIATLEARGKVIDRCNNGAAKADYLVSTCGSIDSPNYSCD